MRSIFYYLFNFCTLATHIKGHALLYEPPNRSSIWRFPEFQIYKPVINNDDNQVFCGGYAVQHQQNGGQCGVCGDNYALPRPRPNEAGGKYDIGLIVRNYTTGSNIFTSSLITSNHLGYFEFSLCSRNSFKDPEEDSCFEKFPLPFSDGSGFRLYPIFIGNTKGYFNTTVSLPPGVTCSACILRWRYITGNTWGHCDVEEGPEGPIEVTAEGCGPQEEFRGCADIAIYE